MYRFRWNSSYLKIFGLTSKMVNQCVPQLNGNLAQPRVLVGSGPKGNYINTTEYKPPRQK
jgi:hypothetical protein